MRFYTWLRNYNYISSLSTAAFTFPWVAVNARMLAARSTKPILSSCVSCSAKRCSGGTAKAEGGVGELVVGVPPKSVLKSRPPIFPPPEVDVEGCWLPKLNAPGAGGAPNPPNPPPIGGIRPDCCNCCIDCCICIIAYNNHMFNVSTTTTQRYRKRKH